jgi:hypothetical protein
MAPLVQIAEAVPNVQIVRVHNSVRSGRSRVHDWNVWNYWNDFNYIPINLIIAWVSGRVSSSKCSDMV